MKQSHILKNNYLMNTCEIKHNMIPFPSSKRLIDALDFQADGQHSNTAILKYTQCDQIHEISYKDFRNSINFVANKIKLSITKELQPNNNGILPIGYLANTSYSYPINLFAIMRLNATPVILSPRNSTAIIVHLLRESGSNVLIYEKAFEEQAMQCKKELSYLELVESIPKIHKSEEYNNLEPLFKQEVPDMDYSEKVCMILHSSGSTSFPKLIKLSNRFFLRMVSHGRAEDNRSDFFGIGLTCAPFFHLFGLSLFIRAIYNTACFALPSSTQVSPCMLIKDIQRYNGTFLIALPFILKQIAEHCNQEKDHWRYFSQLKVIMSGGAILPQDVGNEYLKNNVNIVNGYGSTETGFLANTKPSNISKDFNSFYFYKGIKYHLINVENDICQIIIDANDEGLATGVVKEGNIGYSLGDVYKIIEHNEKEGILKVHILGRADDTIIHISGEKSNPVPIEIDIMSNPYIDKCLVYGCGKLYNCCIISLKKEIAEKIPILKLRNSILDQVEKANKTCPNHSRVFKELVHILPFDCKKCFPITAKGNVIRKKSEKLFAEDIESIYNDFENQMLSKDNDLDEGLGDDMQCIN